MSKAKIIGTISNGDLENLGIQLSIATCDIQEGCFVVANDEKSSNKYYGLISKLASHSSLSDESFLQHLHPELSKIIKDASVTTTGKLVVKMQSRDGTKSVAKTLPEHGAVITAATAADIKFIFGDETAPHNFRIGSTREESHPVVIDLDKFVQRSSGIFGASGTGKSFAVRMMIAGLIKRNESSVLVLDMHSEYGVDDIASDTGLVVKGLKTMFKSKVVQVGIGRGSKIRGRQADLDLEIGLDDLATSDILMLGEKIGLKDTAPYILDALYNTFGDKWACGFKSMVVGATTTDPSNPSKVIPAPNSVSRWAASMGINVMAAEGLRTKMNPILNKRYLVKKPATDCIGQIIENLKQGRSVILSFGNFDTELDYLIISNALTRRIREEWEKDTNAHKNDPTKTRAPRPLVIVVEEAHKLLSPAMASQTSFGTIAREMRKFFVTLAIVDQRPSQISAEIMSQIGTRITGWLGDESDIRAVLCGLPNQDDLKRMLAQLKPKEETLIMGWGVPLPLPIRTRRYDDQFWKDLLPTTSETPGKGNKTVPDMSENIHEKAGEKELISILGF